MFFSPTMFRPVLGPTQRRVQWVPRFIPGVKRPRRDVDHSSPSIAEVQGEWSYASNSPIYAFIVWTGATLQLCRFWLLFACLVYCLLSISFGVVFISFFFKIPDILHTTHHAVFLAVLRPLTHAFSHERIRYNS